MSIVNSARLIGHLGKDAEVKGDANPFTIFSIATTEKWRDKEGNAKEETQWHNCILSGSALSKFLLKGAKVAIDGKIVYREVEKDGTKTTYTQIRVNEINIIKFAGDSDKTTKDPMRSAMDDLIPDDDQLPF